MLHVEQISVADLIPFAKNSRTHSDAQVAQIAGSIREFGFTNPILIDEQNGVIAGHGRLLAARKLNLDDVPCIRLEGLTDAQKRAYVIADNKIALNAGWDDKLLALELKELGDLGVSNDLTGFTSEEIAALSMDDIAEATEDRYTHKVETPKYEPSSEKPSIESLCNREKVEKLLADIKSSNLSEEEKRFLAFAAERHNVFDYKLIADYYSHANAEMQELMERSALVIIDFDRAIENGFVKLTNELKEMFDIDEDE
jgi:ParB-like chromosome segregation protein Spo0J